jgi:hypothetical protein
VNLLGSFYLVQVIWYVMLYMRKNLQNSAENFRRLRKNLVAAATRRPGFVHRYFLWNPKVHTQYYTQSWAIRMKYTLFHTTYFKVHLNTTFPFTPRSSQDPFTISDQNVLLISELLWEPHVPSVLLWFYFPNIVWWRAKFIKLVTQILASSFCVLCRPKLFP